MWGGAAEEDPQYVYRRAESHRGGAEIPLYKNPPHTSSPDKRCEATAQSALGWYRPSVGVPETFGGYRSSGVLRLTIFSSVQSTNNTPHAITHRSPRQGLQAPAQKTTVSSHPPPPHLSVPAQAENRVDLGKAHPHQPTLEGFEVGSADGSVLDQLTLLEDDGRREHGDVAVLAERLAAREVHLVEVVLWVVARKPLELGSDDPAR
eukprot:scaffold4012_cov63-Phaeocystis_antarctica.AAC.5